MNQVQNVDVIILGSGGSGIGAAIYAARFNLKTVVIGDRYGGLIIDTHLVENYPSHVRLSGYELMQKFLEHVKDYPLVEMVEERAADVKKTKNGFWVKTSEGKEFEGKTIIFATGTKHRELNIPGEQEYKNKGVSYCAICDAPLFKNKTVAVVGGSDSAAKEALLLSEYAKKVFVIYRGDKIHPEPINMNRVQEKIDEGKLEVIPNTNVVEVKGTKILDKAILDKPYKGAKEFPVQGLFVDIGHLPQSDLAAKIGIKLNEKNEIIIDKDSKTNIEGAYAAGDVTNRAFKQLITGVAEGVIAAAEAYEHIEKMKSPKNK